MNKGGRWWGEDGVCWIEREKGGEEGRDTEGVDKRRKRWVDGADV